MMMERRETILILDEARSLLETGTVGFDVLNMAIEKIANRKYDP